LLSPTRLWLLCALGGSEVLEGSSKKKKKDTLSVAVYLMLCLEVLI